jgi:hypothetical protein
MNLIFEIWNTIASGKIVTIFLRHGEIESDNNLIGNGIHPTAEGKKLAVYRQ